MTNSPSIGSILPALVLATLLAGCASSSNAPSHQRSDLTGDLRAQDARIEDLQDEIRHLRTQLAASPADSAISRRLRALLDQEEQAQALRRDIKFSADEKAREEFEASRKSLGVKDPIPGHQAP